MEEWSIIWRKLMEIALVLEINSFSCPFALWVHTICTFFKKNERWFEEAATGVALLKKAFLKILQIS